MVRVTLMLLCCLVARTGIAADGEGQADLDRATELKLGAETLEDLGKVADLCESALKKGLDLENERFARQLLTGSLYQRADNLANRLLDGSTTRIRRTPLDLRSRFARQMALQDLQRILKYDDSISEVHRMLAQLYAMPGGDLDKARTAAGKAVETAKDNDIKADALVVRGSLTAEEEPRLKDFAEAIRLQPTHPGAWESRALHYFSKGKYEEAVENFNKLLESDTENTAARLAAAEALVNLKRYDEAIEHVDRAIELAPTPPAFAQRARIRVLQGKTDDALEDLGEALKRQPENLGVRLFRARILHFSGKYAEAREDVETCLRAQPNLVEAIFLRSLISAAEGKLESAIEDLETAVEANPDDPDWKYQLALLYNATDKTDKAIQLFGELIDADAGNWQALRGRGDALLAKGDHASAIKDYEAAMKINGENPGLLNNFAWVLATSPEDPLRDGQRAIKLATKACELTEYKAAHILSTLAAGYAETGDFDTAIKWSEKAVAAQGDDVEDDGQLRNELESYKNKKPWRERQGQQQDQE